MNKSEPREMMGLLNCKRCGAPVKQPHRRFCSVSCAMYDRWERNNAHRHAVRKSPVYSTWRSMVNRCNNPKDTSYPRYGGRGIRVCPRWRVFEKFLEDMGERPEGTTIDRIDNDGHYEPGNCRWATKTQQRENSSRVRLVTFRDRTLNVTAWARELNVEASMIRERLNRGWDIERSLTLPTQVDPVTNRKRW